ncbi:OmpW/AlkL family protein [Comamonas aquatica]|uniref:OmpW/AlkL family protein n=1 Tax=Comamonas aquatica TaxID=225991 RepID=UPI0021B0C69E|nr:OmpW family protein [Comamonas aquatica]MDH1672917.1 OmpW family protein [Comamonas aquatica]MDH1676481.1 OmpW family protein [Comamonas aquatica]
MKKTLLAVAALCAMTSGAAMAQQQDGKWQVRVRAVNLDAANKGEAAKGAAGVSINDKVIPELDISYYFTPNFAAELVLTYPQKQDVRSNGVKIGSLKHLPPSLMAQYHFTNFGAFKPYLGAGINYTRFSNVDLPAGLDVKRNSWGGALQVGFDYALDKNWSLNFDVKKVYIDTTINNGIGKFKIDPILVGVGVGYRF